MNRKNLLFVGVLFLHLFLVSCTKTISPVVETVFINTDSVQYLDIEKGKIIELEATDFSLLYDITHIEFLKEKIIVLSRDKVTVFGDDGKFLFNLGSKGQGPHEYGNIGNIYVKNDLIYLMDISKKILCFNEDGSFVSTTRINENNPYPVADLFPLKNGNYVGKNMFQGDHNPVPIGCILDDNYNFINIIGGKNILSGITNYDNFCQYKDQILYWEILNDTVFVIENYQSIAPKYYIDFRRHAIPAYERKDKDVYDLIDYSNKPENVNKIAGFIGHISEDDNQLQFRFIFQKQTHYVFYNKAQKSARIFCFVDKNNKYSTTPYVCRHNGAIYLSVLSETDFDKNPILIVFDEKLFY